LEAAGGGIRARHQVRPSISKMGIRFIGWRCAHVFDNTGTELIIV
jgi:hypothetical protein